MIFRRGKVIADECLSIEHVGAVGVLLPFGKPQDSPLVKMMRVAFGQGRPLLDAFFPHLALAEVDAQALIALLDEGGDVATN